MERQKAEETPDRGSRKRLSSASGLWQSGSWPAGGKPQRTTLGEGGKADLDRLKQ